LAQGSKAAGIARIATATFTAELPPITRPRGTGDIVAEATCSAFNRPVSVKITVPFDDCRIFSICYLVEQKLNIQRSGIFAVS
jgi:hypothetical protein